MRSSSARRVVVTGGAGFLGSHLCERLVDQGQATGGMIPKVNSALRAVAENAYEVFHQQSLYAQSFYKIRSEDTDEIFNQMIESVVTQDIPIEDAINKAQNDVTDLMIRHKVEQ